MVWIDPGPRVFPHRLIMEWMAARESERENVLILFFFFVTQLVKRSHVNDSKFGPISNQGHIVLRFSFMVFMGVN